MRIAQHGDSVWTQTYDRVRDGWSGGLMLTESGGYWICGTIVDQSSGRSDFYVVMTDSDILEVGDPSIIPPSSFVLSIYPNPFNPTTTISFTLDNPEQVKLVVYDLNGREVQTLVDGQITRGEHQYHFDGGDLPSGLYFARMQTASGMTKTAKLALVK
jgi:hypothetical protein